MLSIDLLGGFRVAWDDGSAVGRLGPKHQGLLAYLALSRGAAVARRRLVGLLWGEHEDAHARHSLSQALTTIRTALGPLAATVLDSNRETVRLARDGFELDVDAFECRASSQDPATIAEACELYRGELLAGVDIDEAEFDQWLLGERHRLATLAVDILARKLEFDVKLGNAEAAIDAARRVVALSPLDESAHARLIELYGDTGRIGLAEAHYRRCSKLLHCELGRAPGEELQRALAAARRCRTSEAARLDRRTPSSGAGETASEAREERRKPGLTARRDWILGAAVAAVLVMVAAVWSPKHDDIAPSRATSLPASATRPSIAVAPFENRSRNPDLRDLAGGITNGIITELARFTTLIVISIESSRRSGDAVVSAERIARKPDVRYVLRGSVRQLDGKLAVDARLIDSASGRYVWAERLVWPTEQIFTAQRDISQTIAGMVGSGGSALEDAEIERARRIPGKDLGAYEFYLRGVEYKKRPTKENNTRAREMFQAAIRSDSRYARAMAECGLTHLVDIFNGWSDSPAHSLHEAEALARRALQVDPSEPWAHISLALVHQIEGRAEAALPLFETAHRLNPNDRDIKQALGYAATFSGSAHRGVELMEQAERLNPYSDKPNRLGMAYFYARRYEDAIVVLGRMAYGQESTAYWLYKAAAHAELGQIEMAHRAVAAALALDGTLNVQGEHRRRLAMGLVPEYAKHLSEALRKAGLPEGS